MQRKDIKAGVIYAVKSSYGQPHPVLFLEDGAAGLYTHERYHYERRRPAYEGAKARAARGFDPVFGYAAVEPADGGHDRDDRDAVLAAMREVDPVAELERFKAGRNPASEILQFAIISNLGKIAPWDDVLAERELQRQRDRKRTEEANARMARTRAAIDGLRQHGIAGTRILDYGAGGEGVLIGIADAERLLAMLSEKNEG